MKLLKSSYENIKRFFTLVNYPQGVDEDFDESCNSAFLNFLDYMYYFLVGCFSIFSAISIYFFVTHAL